MATAYLGIGSNIGDRRKNCIKAIDLLEEAGIRVTGRSSMFETKPWGVEDQPTFINMAISVETSLGPKELLSLLKETEKRMGRKESLRYGPREIDIDILLFDSLVMKEAGLEIPHPLMHERDFVLEPLAEIAPDVVHPTIKKTVRQLIGELRKAN